MCVGATWAYDITCCQACAITGHHRPCFGIPCMEYNLLFYDPARCMSPRVMRGSCSQALIVQTLIVVIADQHDDFQPFHQAANADEKEHNKKIAGGGGAAVHACLEGNAAQQAQWSTPSMWRCVRPPRALCLTHACIASCIRDTCMDGHHGHVHHWYLLMCAQRRWRTMASTRYW